MLSSKELICQRLVAEDGDDGVGDDNDAPNDGNDDEIYSQQR